MIIKRIFVISALFSLSFNLQAASSAEDCSAITDDAKRLQCYDNFLKSQKSTPKEETPEPTQQDGTVEDGAEKEVVEQKPTQPLETPEPELTKEEKFGAEQLKNPPKQLKEDEADEIHSRAIGLYKMWEKGVPVTLENGQVWEIIDYRSAYHMIENPKVTIEKNLFGGYRLGIEGLNKRFRVKRKK